MRLYSSSIVNALIASVCLMIGAVYVQIYFLTVPIVDRNAARDVKSDLVELGEIYAASNLTALIIRLDARLAAAGDSDAVYALADKFGNLLAGNLAGWPKGVDTSGEWRTGAKVRLSDSSEIDVGYRAIALSENVILFVGRDMTMRTEISELLQRSLLSSFALIAVSVLVAAVILSAIFGNRMRAISDTAHDIIAGELSRRVPVGAADDEFAELGRSINFMLARIENLMSSMQMITDSMAHHVRGQLVRLHARLDEIAQTPCDSSKSAALAETLAEFDRLLQTLDGLIEIARADAGLSRAQMKSVAVPTLLCSLAEIYEPLAEAREMKLTVDAGGAVLVRGIEPLIAQALSNLIENALKYTPDGGRISLTASAAPTGLSIGVSDTGPGIAEMERQKAVERFSRLAAAADIDGKGLGLSIVAAVARLHEAELLLEDNAPGLKVVLRFPPFSPSGARPSRWRRGK